MPLELIASLAGLIFPPILDLVKKKIIKNEDPVSTLGSIALSKPEYVAQYIDAFSKLVDSQARFFNRDVVGNVSSWVSNMRASIRPIVVILSLIFVVYCKTMEIEIDEGTSSMLAINITSWFGSKLI